MRKRPVTVKLSPTELEAVILAVGDRRAGEWDESFAGEGEALERAYARLVAAQGNA